MNLTDSDAARRNLAALVDFGKLINSGLDLKSILNDLLLTCFGKFHTTRGIVAIFDEEKILRIKAVKGIPSSSIKNFPAIKSGAVINSSELNDYLKENALPFMSEIFYSQGLLGLLILGERLSKKEYSKEDKEFIDTIVNVSATAIENSLMFDRLKKANRSLDSKVTMLSSLFELSKEFSGILEVQRVSKLLVYSVIGQLMVSSYAVVICDHHTVNILESKFPLPYLTDAIKNCHAASISSPVMKEQIIKDYPDLFSIGIEVIIPMQIQGETKGIILLGKRMNSIEFSESDIEYIYSIGSLAIISIENSKLFKEALEKQKMDEDLEIARNIQKNLLPKFIPKFLNFEISAVNISSRQVGGDYYDIIRLDQENFLIAIGDVSGKGVPASLLMANLQACLKAICRQEFKLDEATGIINDLISENTMGENFITFFWAILNEKTKRLTYVNAGHNPPLLVRKGEIIKLTVGGMILGVMKTISPYLSQDVQLESGDALILFTDGVTEAMSSKREEYTDERLEDLVIQAYTLKSEEIIKKIRSDIHTHVQNAHQSDDITLLTVKVK